MTPNTTCIRAGSICTTELPPVTEEKTRFVTLGEVYAIVGPAKALPLAPLSNTRTGDCPERSEKKKKLDGMTGSGPVMVNATATSLSRVGKNPGAEASGESKGGFDGVEGPPVAAA